MFWCIPHVHNSPPPANLGCIPVSHLLQLFASILDCLYHLPINFLAERAFNVSRVLAAGLEAEKAES